MPSTPRHYTVRLPSLPPSRVANFSLHSLFPPEDAALITCTSLVPASLGSSSSNVATVTFNGTPGFVEGKTRIRRGLDIDEDFFGLTPLNNIKDKHIQADLIAITGLACPAFGSWQNDEGAMWLRDYLPQDIPGLRIFIYGYPSKLDESVSQASMWDYTQEFMKTVAKLRRNEEVERPLILVGHSFGCVIIKQAMVESISVITPMPDFHRSVCGIVFFGAPHRGLDNPALANILASKLPAALARDLYPGSSLLVSLNQFFSYTCEDITVVSCYETNVAKQVEPSDPESSWEWTGLSGLPVPRDSACLNWPNEKRVAVHADHWGIAKLTNSPGSTYHRIKDEIKCLVEHAPAVMERRRDVALLEQEVLDLFFMLQYEFSWLKIWGTLVVQQGPAAEDPMEPSSNTNSLSVIPSVPYGHPAYNVVSEISLLARSLNILLEPHRDRMTASTDENGHSTKGCTLDTPASASSMPKFTLFNPEQREGDENHLGAYQENTYNIDDWNSTDRAQFRLLMSKFRQANNKLLQLSPLSQSLDLIASSDVLDQLPGDSPNLRHMEESMQPSDLYASLSKRASLKRQYSDPDVLNTAATLLKSINTIDMKGHAISFTRRFLTTFHDQSDLGQQAPAWVLVEWRYYDMANTAAKQRQAKVQALKLARDLSISNKPPLLRTLHCVGLVEDHERKRFGFLFEIPPRSDMRASPLSLHSYFQGPNVAGKPCPLPTLSQRFRLALSLALSLWELHTSGWLHKSFHSGNVLFFPVRITNEILISDPFIGGFEVGRPDSDGQLSLDVEGGGFDIYKHPELRGPSNQPQGRPAFGRKHDIYALGLLLFEIGFWSPLRDFYKEGNTPFQTTERLMRIARENLPHQMGDFYTETVLDCLDCVVPRLGTDTSTLLANRSMSDIDDEYTRGMSMRKFVEKIIYKLERCHFQE